MTSSMTSLWPLLGEMAVNSTVVSSETTRILEFPKEVSVLEDNNMEPTKSQHMPIIPKGKSSPEAEATTMAA